jgi:hypothetical protein
LRDYRDRRHGTDLAITQAVRGEYCGFQAQQKESLALLAAERRGELYERSDDDDLPL